MQFVIPILIGLSAGVCSGLFGIGGGIIIVPLLVFFLKIPQQMATATSLMALLLPTGALGLWHYYQKGFLTGDNIKIGFFIAAGLFIGAFFGAKIATSLQSGTLTKIFAVFLVVIAVRLWVTSD